ncbi:unnamed protein product [Polarella glacialis]|uniref:Fungal lipase-like domain-containing protein n=2 Tax=Polarella glacialis TaxID=89957 RepID=A0A813DW19_POLGL|nr:unnamed protein product [Polarella glacialis]
MAPWPVRLPALLAFMLLQVPPPASSFSLPKAAQWHQLVGAHSDQFERKPQPGLDEQSASALAALGRRLLAQPGSVPSSSESYSLLETFGVGSWDLPKIFRDEPRGAYLNLLEPLAYACYLTYPTTNGSSSPSGFQGGQFEGVWANNYKANASSPGALSGDGHWDRLVEVERDPEEGGPHMRAIIDRGAKRAILAFRGACLDPAHHQCNNDMCAVVLSRTTSNNGSCGSFMHSLADYIYTAAEDVKRARQLLGPDVAIMVTGHSLGGLLALVLGAVVPDDLDFQVVALEPTPFGNVLRHQLGISEEKIAALRPDRRYAVYDPTDLLSTSFGSLEELRPSTTVCTYEGAPMPEECTECVASSIATATASGVAVGQASALQGCFLGPPDPDLHTSRCKDAAHFLDNYAEVLLRMRGTDGSTFLPTCKVVHSTAQLVGADAHT